jgi:hypothetical protein
MVTERELGQVLYQMYSTADHGKRVAQIHLFGIKYADIILRNHLSVRNIIQYSGLNSSYATEVSKGINLAEYVEVKNRGN